MATDHNTVRSNREKSSGISSNGSGGDSGSGSGQTRATDHETVRSNRENSPGSSNGSGGDSGSGSGQTRAQDHNTTRSNRASIHGGGGGSTQGLGSTLGVIKSGISLVSVIILIAASADVYKMYDDHVTINLEDHVTDAVFQLTGDRNSIVGEIAFDIPKMGYFDKSIDVLIHLKILESDPITEDDFTFEYNLGSGEEIYDEFRLDDLDPVTKEKIDNGDPLDIEYTITITIIYLGVELGPTTSEIGTKVTTMQTA